MRITAHPQPTGGVALNRRADGKTCGLQGPTPITCSGSATCAAVVAAADERLYAGCFETKVAGIATLCKDISAPQGVASQGVLTCAQHENCATRFWHLRPSTDEFDRPFATEYFCNPDGWVQVTGTYQPSEFPWNTVLANEMPTGVAPRPVTTGLVDSPPPSPNAASESPTGPGVIAGAAVGGVIIVLLAAVVLWSFYWRRRTNAASRSKAQRPESPSPQSQPKIVGSGKDDVKVEATPSATTTPTPEYSPPDASERIDVAGGLPTSDDLRRMKPGSQFGGMRGAPSVMTTDLSETLTIGDADGIDDIHVIGHGR
ncbi:hypothetical protein QBC39DRAFT_357947 [Podospora conica]|nr:hypothetical protein QBC39DRAFT_357947 [Schizothecium conicum]